MSRKVREATIDWLSGEDPIARMERKGAEEATITPGEQCDGVHLCQDSYTCKSGLVLHNFSRDSARCPTLVNEGECPPFRARPRSLRYDYSEDGARIEAEDALKRYAEVYESKA